MKPRWHDSCDHPTDCYISTVEDGKQTLDIYLYPDHDGPSVCLRYGNEASEYISPGSALQFLWQHRSDSLYPVSAMTIAAAVGPQIIRQLYEDRERLTLAVGWACEGLEDIDICSTLKQAKAEAKEALAIVRQYKERDRGDGRVH